MTQPLEPVAEAFRTFVRYAEPISPLYGALARRIAEDPLVLRVAAYAPLDNLPPNLFFAAVHLLLAEAGGKAPLARHYASFVEAPLPAADAFPAFRDFVLQHAVEIAQLVAARRTATNEIQRAAVLMPAFALAARRGTPLQMLEIGTSAGLLLNWDRCGYDYGSRGRVHHPVAQLTLACEAEGPLPLPAALPPLQERIGLDLAPLDVKKHADAAWLRALIWPEQQARRARLEAAIRLARLRPPRLVAGDALERMEGLLRGLPRAGTVVVFHAFCLAQFPAERKAVFLALLDRLGAERPIVRVGYEHEGEIEAGLKLQVHGQETEARLLARATPHGERLRWLGGG